MGTLGNKVSAGTGRWLQINCADGGSDNQRAIRTANFVVTAPQYITRLGVWARRQPASGSPQIWLGIYEDTGAGPGILLGSTARLSVPNNGNDVSGSINWVHPSVRGSRKAVLLESGKSYYLGIKVEKVDIEVASWSTQVTHYRRRVTALNTQPTSPFGATSTNTADLFSVYADTTENTKPTATQSTPANAAAINGTPSLGVLFSDPQFGAATVDRPSQISFEVRAQSDPNTLLWGGAGATFFTNQPGDRTETGVGSGVALITRNYAGSTLLANGTVYEWRSQVADDSGVWSDWTDWRTFTINPYGNVDVSAGAPSGKIDAAISTLNYTGVWTHPTARPTTKVQIVAIRNNEVYKLSPLITKAVSNNGTITITAAEATFDTLPPGAYEYAIRGLDNNGAGNWSPYSARRAFVLNSPPTTPTNLQPPLGNTVTSAPLLEWLVDDPDTDDDFAAVGRSRVQILLPGNPTPIEVVTTNYDIAKGKGYLQLYDAAGVGNPPGATTITRNNSTAFQWRVRGEEQVSGGSYVNGQWSAYSNFLFTTGPEVTVTSPTVGETKTTSVPTVTFNIPNPNLISRYEVKVYEQDARLPLRSSGIISLVTAASNAAFNVPVGWLRNGGDYDLEVIIYTATGNLVGRSLRIPFTVVYAPTLAPSNYQASPTSERHDYDQSPSSILLSWEQTQYSPGEFGGYVIYRREANQDASEMVKLRTITAPGQTRWKDQWPRSNTLYVYGLSQIHRVGADVIESDIIEAEAQVVLQVPIVNSAFDPDIRFPMMWLELGFGGGQTRPETPVITWGSNNKETIITTPVEATTTIYDFTVEIISDARGDMYDHIADLEAVLKCGHPLLFRPERPEETIWMRFTGVKWKRIKNGRAYSGQIKEIDFTPGEDGGT